MMIPRTHGEAQPPSVFGDLVFTAIEKAKWSFNHSHALNSSSMPLPFQDYIFSNGITRIKIHLSKILA